MDISQASKHLVVDISIQTKEKNVSGRSFMSRCKHFHSTTTNHIPKSLFFPEINFVSIFIKDVVTLFNKNFFNYSS